MTNYTDNEHYERDNNNWVSFNSRADAENFANKLIDEGANNVVIQVCATYSFATFKVCKDFVGK